MANKLAVLAGLGAILSGAVLLARRGKAKGVALAGEFGITPESVVFSGAGHTSATITFSGSVVSTSNAPFSGAVRLQVFSGSPLPIVDKSIVVSVPANGMTTFSVTAQITEAMLAGDVTAAATLVNSAGVGLQTQASAVLATITATGGQSMSGTFGIS